MQRSEMLLEEVAGEQRAMFTCCSPSEAGHAQQGEAAAQPAGPETTGPPVKGHPAGEAKLGSAGESQLMAKTISQLRSDTRG